MVLAILQARMSSTRLPGKVMADLAGAPMIARQIERVRRAKRIDRLVVATSNQASDDPLVAFLESEAVTVFRGPLNDVLARFSAAAEAFGPADHVVRLTADCPLTDPTVIDAVIAHHLATGADYTSNVLGERTFAQGLDVEVMTGAALTQARAEASEPYEREHVTPFLYRRPDRFRLEGVAQDRSDGAVGWTVDTPEDLHFVRLVYEALYPQWPDFGPDLIRDWVRSRPTTWMNPRRA